MESPFRVAAVFLCLVFIACARCFLDVAIGLLFVAITASLSCNSFTLGNLENRRFFVKVVQSVRREAYYASRYQLEKSEFVPMGWVVGPRARWFAHIEAHSLTYYTWKWNPPPSYDDADVAHWNEKDSNIPFIDEFVSLYEVNRTVAYQPRDLERVPHSMPIARQIVVKLLNAEQESGVDGFGGVFAFNAPSGAGKTIAARCLACLLNATLVSNWDATQLDFFVDTAIPSREKPLVLLIEDADAIIHRIPNIVVDSIKKHANVILIISTAKPFSEIRAQKPVLLRPGRIDAIFNFEARGYLAENV